MVKLAPRFVESAKVGTKKFYEVCDAVDKLIDEGLVYFKDRFFLYYGTADSSIAVAISFGV